MQNTPQEQTPLTSPSHEPHMQSVPPPAGPSSVPQKSYSPRIQLQEGEHIVMDVLPSKFWTMGTYIISLGLWAIWRTHHRYILTNQRIVLTKGIVAKSQRAVPLDRVQDAMLHTSPFSGGRVTLSTAGGPLGFESIRKLTQHDAREFLGHLTALISARTRPSV